MRESVASSNRWPKQGTLALFAIVVGGFLAFYFLHSLPLDCRWCRMDFLMASIKLLSGHLMRGICHESSMNARIR